MSSSTSRDAESAPALDPQHDRATAPAQTAHADSPVVDAPTPGTTRPDRPGVTGPTLLVLALLSAVAPFATDLYLPAFPEMTGELGASATAVQLTLTAFLIGITIGQLIFGPLSDRFGRFRPLLLGAIVCVAAGVAAVFAPNVAVLIVARFAQGLGGAAGMVIGRAIITDLAVGKQAARAFSLMMIVGGVAPVAAPLLGGFLVNPLGWRGILAVVLAISVLMLVSIVAVLRETLPADRRSGRRSTHDDSADRPASFLTAEFLGYSLTFAFAFAVMMAYISASPFLYQDMIGLGSIGYGMAFGANALALMAVSAISARLVTTRPVRGLVAIGLSIICFATVVFAILVVTGVPALWLAVPLFVMVASLGLIFGNATALAMGAVGSNAGGASAILGALQFGLGAAVSPLVSIKGSDTAGPLAIVMLIAAAIAVAAFVVAGRAGTAQPTEEPV